MGKHIAVLTWFNRGRNYGQTLQAFALNYTLRRMGHRCTMLSYGRSGPRLTEEEIKGLKGDAQKQQREFTRFIKEHIDYSPRLREPEDVRRFLQENEFDIALCGSDQIWNIHIPSFEMVYFLNFSLPYPKVAYAASMMSAKLIHEYEQYPEIPQLLEDFSAVSVRENSGREIVEQLTHGKVRPTVVLDPTLLLTREEWRKEVPLPEVEWKDYLFCYMFDASFAQQILIQRFAKSTGCGTIVFLDAGGHEISQWDGIRFKQVKGISIEMFLSLICHAKAVATDSFHGTAFSIQFEKNFMALENGLVGEERLDRVATLLEKVGLPRHLVRLGQENLASLEDRIHYSAVNARLYQERAASLKWLGDAVERSQIKGVRT